MGLPVFMEGGSTTGLGRFWGGSGGFRDVAEGLGSPGGEIPMQEPWGRRVHVALSCRV